jgi:DNA polymerase III delta prime subunit
MADWPETYRLTTLSEVRDNDPARDAFEEWAETWDDHREAVVLHGSPGVGQPSAVYALANDLGRPVQEMNASDARTADEIERNISALDPADSHTDGDGTTDGAEDIDRDNLSVSPELDDWTEFGLHDTDDDGLADGAEVKIYSTDPSDGATNGDGLEDGTGRTEQRLPRSLE